MRGEKSLKENPATSEVMVMVSEGVATLSGEVTDEASKASLETSVKGMKGVKSVQNNTTVAAPSMPAAPVVITADDPLMSAVKDATKDYPGVTATVADGVITLTGDISKSSLPKLMMALNSLKPKKIENKLIIK